MHEIKDRNEWLEVFPLKIPEGFSLTGENDGLPSPQMKEDFEVGCYPKLKAVLKSPLSVLECLLSKET